MSFKIGDRRIGVGEPPFCIAEVGINHNGDLGLAFEMIKVAKESGADAVKFQTFSAKEFCSSRQTFTYKSQGKTITEPMLDMFRRHEFTKEQWFSIKSECDRQSIMFMSTPQNRADLDLLLELGIPAIKVGSDDLTNTPLIGSYAKEGLPLILSSGMSDLAEVFDSVDVAGGFDGHPVALLLCTSQYPTPPNEVNLSRLGVLKSALPSVIIGFSDHTQGSLASSLAVALGATILEKHFTMNHNLAGPDHWFSENPDGLSEWIHCIRTAYSMQGNPLVRPTLIESRNKREYQRKLVAVRPIALGEIMTEENVALHRVPGGEGLPPKFLDYLLGRAATCAYEVGNPIKL